MSSEDCFLCGQTSQTLQSGTGFVTISTKMPASQRPLKSVLAHLANCLRTKLIFSSETSSVVCQSCYKELVDYDNLMVKLLASQKKLSIKLQISLNSSSWKEEYEEFEVPCNDEVLDVQLADALNPELDTKEELIEDNESMLLEMDAEHEIEPKLDHNGLEVEPTMFEAQRRPTEDCVQCSLTFKNKITLRRHVVEAHNLKVFECNVCGAVRKDEEYLELHMNIHEGKTEFECRYCPKKFSRPVNTLRHMRKHWDKKAYQCEKCGERFSLDNMLYNHRLIHEAEENPLICSICHQSFKSRKTYNHHKLTHQEHRPRHHCNLCPKSFTERYTLKMHLSTHNRGKETKKVTEISKNKESIRCVICELEFQTKELLNEHLKDGHDVILVT